MASIKHKNRVFSESGFTIAELMTVMAISSILMMIALPNVGQIGSQMRASEAIRTLESDLSEFRAESIRLRAASSITFSSSGYTWDIYNDGTIDAERVFAKNVSWTGATPSSLSFNGLGLARGLITTKQLSLTSSGSTLKLSVNRNGHIDIS